jgi:hypothetical protein
MRKVWLLLSVAALACGKQTFLAAAFVQTPALPNPVGGQGFPQLQILTAYFGTIDTTDPTKIDASKVAAITDATASVSFHHFADPAVQGDVDEDRWLFPPGIASAWKSNSGTYSLDSNQEPRLTFEASVPYTLVLMTADGQAYGARLAPGPHEDIAEFQSSTCPVTITQNGVTVTTQAARCKDGSLGQALTVTRAAAAGGTLPSTLLPAFVLVGSVDPNKPTAEPSVTYKTVPADAAALLKYVLSDLPYRVPSFVVPATAFPSAGWYVVTVLVVNQGKVSSNAFLGSTALALAGSAGVYHVQ